MQRGVLCPYLGESTVGGFTVRYVCTRILHWAGTLEETESKKQTNLRPGYLRIKC